LVLGLLQSIYCFT